MVDVIELIGYILDKNLAMQYLAKFGRVECHPVSKSYIITTMDQKKYDFDKIKKIIKNIQKITGIKLRPARNHDNTWIFRIEKVLK